MRIDVDDRATADLLEIVDYLSDYSPSAAERVIGHFEDVLRQLRDFPASGQIHAANPATRVLRRGVYRFIYSVRDGDVLLLRILDGRAAAE